MTDIEIARQAALIPIKRIAENAGIPVEAVELYGEYKCKINPKLINDNRPDGKLILVTAISPTSAGEGKTTTSVGLADALSYIGKKSALALREPSLGPVFGVKGGAAGGGYAQVVPMEEINLHFTGDIHAVGAANNLLAAMIDNHIFHGNALSIDQRRITWRRCMDMNDRQLRHIVCGLHGKVNGMPREDSFDITVASEVMAILCLADGIADLKLRLGKIIVGYTYDGKPVTAADLGAAGAMASLLKDAIKPNLVQTLEHTPAFIHGGPFANIAHGCNSVAATRLALKVADYVVTEAGFGADLGAEKFIDIKCRASGLRPSACVIVATVRALKHHGGCAKESLKEENLQALEKGLPNLIGHIANIKNRFNIPAVVAINRFTTDTEDELGMISRACGEYGVKVALSEVWEHGGKGGEELAREVVKLADGNQAELEFAYHTDIPIKDKIECIVKSIYGGSRVTYDLQAEKDIALFESQGFGNLPVCMAKTQYSFSDNPALLGRPSGFAVNVSSARVSAGAGFIVVQTGSIMTMPGLSKKPAAENIDIDNDGVIHGLF